MTTPTQQDLEAVARRTEIARRFQREYNEAHLLATTAFGPGWEPCGRHFLVDKDEEDRARREGGQMQPAATVYSARKDGVQRHFTVSDGIPREVASLEEGFGPMLHENHTTRTFEHKGERIPCGRYSLFRVGYKLYRPQSAEALAAGREKREAKAVEKEAEGNLFADLIRAEGYVPKRGRRGGPG